MPLNQIVGSFNIGTGAAATTKVITGLGFKPKVIILYWNGDTSAADAYDQTSPITKGYGFGISSASRACTTNYTEDVGSGASVCRNAARTDCIIHTINTSGTDVGKADLTSMDADGFTLTIATQFTISLRIMYMALGGADLANFKIGTFQEPAATGNTAVTGLGFSPDAFFLMGVANTGALPYNGTSSRMSFGMAARSGGVNGCVAWCYGGKHNVATSVTKGYIRTAQIYAEFDSVISATLQSKATLNSWDTDGFTLNWASVLSATPTIIYLALQGGGYHFGSFTNPADATPASQTGFGFRPKGGLMISGQCPIDADGTPHNDDKGSFGAWDAEATIKNRSQLHWDRNGQTTGNTHRGIQYTGVFSDHVNNNTVIQEVMAIDSNDINGITYHMTTTLSAEGNLLPYMAFGDAGPSVYTNIWM